MSGKAGVFSFSLNAARSICDRSSFCSGVDPRDGSAWRITHYLSLGGEDLSWLDGMDFVSSPGVPMANALLQESGSARHSGIERN
jgi:hypothetical protein